MLLILSYALEPMLDTPSRTLWPSGLRRWLKAPVRKGVVSKFTGVSFMQVTSSSFGEFKGELKGELRLVQGGQQYRADSSRRA